MTVYYNRILKCAVSIVVLAAMFLASLSYSGGMAYAADDKSVPYVMTIYNEQNGLPTGEANTILQTADGYIWIGSYGGLIRYDGSVFRNYSVENAITSSSIRSLFEDSKGRLWIGTNDTGVIMMEKDVFTAIASPEDHSFLCIRDFAEDDNGRIYVASNSGMAEVTGDTLSPIDAPEVKGNAVYNVAVDSYDRVWGCMNNGECAVVKDGKLVGVVNSNDYLSGSEVYSVAADSSGNIVMGTSSDKVMVLSFKSESLDKADVEVRTFSTDGIITHNSVNVDKSGDILVSGINGLAVIAQDGSVTRFGEAQKAVSANISICDYENNFWLASTSYGVIKYTLGCFTSPNTVAELENIAVNAIAISKGYHYIGTDTGLIICDENWHRVENELTEMYSGIRIRCIIKDRNDNIWIASYSDFAAVCYDPSNGSVMKYSSANGLAGDKSRVIYELSDGRIAVGTQSGVNIIVNGIISEKYTYDDGMINPSVLCFAEGDEGQIYVGSDGNGIYEIKDGQVINHGFNDGLGEGVVLRMLRNSDGGGWFASVGSSLYYWDTVTFKRITNFDKSAGSIFEFYDINGMLWILQNNGITAVDKQQLLSGEQTDCIHYGFSHGMTGSLNANTWNCLDDDGKLYMATRNGISVFGFRGVDNSLPNITVNSVKVDGVMLEHPLELQLNSNAQRITIDFPRSPSRTPPSFA
ncbi:MAG: two-component regulator propeller domain-containing protein [Oscillospiraceae bacterium]